MAAILAVMEDDTLVHGPIEALFTATEETGMEGAFGLKGDLLKGDILLNLDSEDEGELYVGCAGGLDANIAIDYVAEPAAEGKEALQLSVKGCKGGHSGIQIICQRANANKLLFRLLRQLSAEMSFDLAAVDGGGLRNAIPREALATILVEKGSVEAVKATAKTMEATFVAEFADVEDSIVVAVESVAMPESVIPAQTARNLMAAVVACPNGVEKMSLAMEDLVQTSNNLARVVSDGKQIKLQTLIRSSVRSEKEAVGDAIKALFEMAGGSVELSGAYDGWNPNMQSPILKAMLSSYEALYGVRPAIKAIHAGLECGIISTNYPELDMISFGPTIRYPHSPDEKVEIASVEKFYDFLTHTLANAPKK